MLEVLFSIRDDTTYVWRAQKEEAAVKAKDDREAAEAKMRAEIEAEMKVGWRQGKG